MTTVRTSARALLACAFLLAPAGMARAATTTCTGGTIAPGNYGTFVVTGRCALPDSGTVNVNGSLTVTATGALDGVKLSTLIVTGNLFVNAGGALNLGCSEELGCSGPSHHRIGQSVRATNALAVILHNDTIVGSVLVSGGGGGLNCNPRALLKGLPAYFDLEDNVIGQSVTIANAKSCWLGVIRNTVHGTVSIHDNAFADPDANEVVSNTIFQTLTCSNNSPPAQLGDSGGDLNAVRGFKLGECASL